MTQWWSGAVHSAPRSTAAGVAAVVVAATLASGCISHVRVPYEGPSVSHRLVASAGQHPLFDYPRQDVPVDLRATPEHDTDHYRAWHLAARPVADNGQPDNLVKARYYQSRLPGRRGLVIVLPIWGSSSYPPDKTMFALLKHSAGELNVLRVEGPNRLIDYAQLKASHSEAAFIDHIQLASDRVRHAAIDTRRLIDWAQLRPEIDSGRIGLVGFSIGAIVAALVYQHDPRLAAVVPVMGSAHIDRVVVTCPGRLLDVQKTVLPRFGWTLDHYRGIVNDAFSRVDPARFENLVDARRILLIDALNDSCMPRSGQDALWHALGRPERISMRYDHKTSFLGMTPLGFNYLRGEIVEFLAARLANDPLDVNTRSWESAAGDPIGRESM